MSATQREKTLQWDLAPLRADYLATLERLGAAAQAVRDALDAAAGALTLVRDQVRDEARVSDLIAGIDPKPLRVALSESLTELERARHHSQKLLFRILFVEGTNMSDIARSLGDLASARVAPDQRARLTAVARVRGRVLTHVDMVGAPPPRRLR